MQTSRQHSAPIIIHDTNSIPLQLGQVQTSTLSEGTLQRLIAAHPSLIPIDEIEPAYGPMTCLGLEVPTPAGPLDILCTSPQGYLTLIETKLWRNPQSRREVVGQTIDYAKELSKWSFGDLDAAIRRATQPDNSKGKGILS